MENNQNYIVEQLRGQGLSDNEIQIRLQLWEKSRNCGGSFDPLSGTYARIPLPDEVLDIESRPVPTKTVGEAAASSNIPPLNNTQEQQDKEFLAQFGWWYSDISER